MCKSIMSLLCMAVVVEMVVMVEVTLVEEEMTG
jgi:hypothetical protein